jgi:hypothetical protein
MKFRSVILVIGFLLCAPCALGQSCAMCYGSAKSTTKEGQKAINKAVLVLLVPPVSCLTLGVWLAFRYGKRRDREQNLSVSGWVQPVFYHKLESKFHANPRHSPMPESD